MKKYRNWLFAAVAALSLSSCSSLLTTVADKSAQIQKGMSKEEVVAIMGNPAYRRFNEVSDQWEYRTRLVNGGSDVVVIDFRHGRVSGMESFFEHDPCPALVHPEKPKN